ncbi:alpha/beta hydrolase [Zavarzinella formosa]|uniref:alpha/beta hydrolase n=1 Tax=Zavarzinella formosa TaxID=360055 RepID=UPI0002DC1A06|nr:alpha/beta hydrolase [Zavarzinella formosa]
MMKHCWKLLAIALLIGAITPSARSADEARVRPDIVYGHKDGLALTFDVISPAKPSGAAIIWIQSGGWYSTWTDPAIWPAVGKPYLDKGYTLIILRHGSAPKYAIPDAVADVRRAVRFIRMKAADYGVDPERLGVTGGSAGGHLTLMLATTGDDGDPMSKDPVLKNSSKIAAAVALYPPTDISKWVTDPPEPIKSIPTLKPPLTFDAKLAPELSPLLKVTAKTAPSLIIHGDKDQLVPIIHGQQMRDAMEAAKAPVKLVTIEGAGHGYTPKQNQDTVLPESMKWFNTYLAEKKKEDKAP